MATKNKSYIVAVGRRREAIARIRLGDKSLKKGEFMVNGKKVFEYFKGEIAKVMYEKPFKVTDTLGKYAISVSVSGGGSKSQIEATVLGISRALSKTEESFKKLLRVKGLLTVDQRTRERRKVGMGGKARRKKQSPKR